MARFDDLRREEGPAPGGVFFLVVVLRKFGLVGRVAEGHGPEEAAEGPDVGLGGVEDGAGLGFPEFRRAVGHRRVDGGLVLESEDVSPVVEGDSRGGHRSEVHQERRAVVGEEDVLRLDVAVRKAFGVDRPRAVAGSLEDRRELRDGPRLVALRRRRRRRSLLEVSVSDDDGLLAGFLELGVVDGREGENQDFVVDGLGAEGEVAGVDDGEEVLAIVVLLRRRRRVAGLTMSRLRPGENSAVSSRGTSAAAAAAV
mmetsp:Transcript_25070/g.81044  ORF Transcript_25070/g.81044 Transcript_25070/m.81044 type:complete len:255 (+) Transcript_25070:492-1256(+)